MVSFFFLPLPSDCSESLSEVASSVACWSVSGGGYRIHLWRNWLLGLVGRLTQWLELDFVLGCRLAPEVGK